MTDTTVDNHRSSTINKRKLDDDQVPSSSRIRSRKRKPSHFCPTSIQIFIRSFPRGKTLVIRAHSTNSVKDVCNKIMLKTSIPIDNQWLVYKGKHLWSEQTLAYYGIERDTTLHILSSMLSTYQPKVCQLIHDIISMISNILKSNVFFSSDSDHIIKLLVQFITMTPEHNIVKVCRHTELFVSSSASSALVMLCMSLDTAKKTIADECIHSFVNSFKTMLPESVYNVCAPIVSEFCKLFRGAAGIDDCLYTFCQSRIGDIVDAIRIATCNTTQELSLLNDIFLFVLDVVVAELSHDLQLSMESIESIGLSMSIMHDFTEYMCLVRKLFSLKKDGTSEAMCDRASIECLNRILFDLDLKLYELLDKMDLCLRKLEDQLGLQEKGKGNLIVSWWSQYLLMLKELNSILELFNSSEVFWQKMRQMKVSLCFLIMTFAKKSDNYLRDIEHKEVTNLQVQRHFAMMML